MKTKQKYDPNTYWFDARHHATQKSIEYGHCWIVQLNGLTEYSFVISEDVEDAPEDYLEEYIDGEQQ